MNELKELTLEMYRSLSSGDPSFFEQRLVTDRTCVIIGTAPEEWWDDGKAALDSIRDQMKSVGTALQISAGDIRAHSEGDVGWIADRPTLSIGGVAVPCRHTSVFVRRDGEWRLVQQHFSIGVKNQDAFGSASDLFGSTS